MAKNEQKNTMAAWLWRAPIKFTGLYVLGMIVLTVALVLITMPFSKPSPGFIVATVLAFIGFCIYKLIKFTPPAPLDRKSFIGVDIGITIITTLLYFVLPMLVIRAMGITDYNVFVMYFAYYLSMMAATNPILLTAISLVLAVFLTYVIGLMLINYVIVFRRGQMMGVSKLKLWLSFPFGMHLLWLPQFFLAEDKKPKEVVQIKSKWYNDFMNWIVRRPLNTIVVWVVMTTIGTVASILTNGHAINLIFQGVLLILFVVPLIILGVKKMRNGVKGWFSVLAVVINILAIAGIIWYAVLVTRAIKAIYPNNPTVEFVEETDDASGGMYHDEYRQVSITE